MADSVDHEEHDSKHKGEETVKVADQLTNPDADSKDEKKSEANKKDEEVGSGEESSEGEEHLGLLDKPVVLEGKRERKSTEFLYTQTPTLKKETKPIVFEGKGQSLGSIERVNFELGRTSYLELKPLHRLLYGRDGRQNEVKKNIRNFNGFSFDKDSKQYELKQQAVERFTMDSLKRLCDIFDIEKKGKRDDLTEKVMDFLMSPKSSGRPLPSSKQKKTNKRKKTKSTDKKAEVSKRKRAPAKSKKEVKDEDDDNDEEEKTDEDEGDENEEETEKPPKKKRKTEKADKPKEMTPVAKEKQKGKDTSKGKTKENKISDKKKSPKKKEPVAVKIATPLKKQSPKKKPPKEKPVTVDDDSSSDEEPLAKKAKKQPPTDNELETSVKKILHGADLEQVTMKSVCKQIFEMFPDFDLTSRKDFIKETVKKVIS